MNKELTPLEKVLARLVHNLMYTANSKQCDEDIETLKYALADYVETQKKIKVLEIIKELFDFDFAIRFGDNQPMIRITNKRNGQYWELPETSEICDLLKKVLLC